VIDIGEDFCGEFPIHQPMLERTVSFDRDAGTENGMNIINTVSYYASTAHAEEVLDQQLSLIENCPEEQTEVIQGTEFRVLSITNRFSQQILANLSPTCLAGALVLQTFTSTDEANPVGFTSNIAVLRCANVITVVNVTPATDALQDQATTELTNALSATANKVSRIQLIP
jgi:hypothetical protein